ncbi:hypothetical protein RRG08_037399 [Elysia crispata]|uniref:Uncharacterized protein n=1 Tax=Elysia crispata TaxID=231223 RepID=A0AAE1AFF0_9GAST|nr:hypothetical protein RRG08_037399 [Elysia crispata]
MEAQLDHPKVYGQIKQDIDSATERSTQGNTQTAAVPEIVARATSPVCSPVPPARLLLYRDEYRCMLELGGCEYGLAGSCGESSAPPMTQFMRRPCPTAFITVEPLMGPSRLGFFRPI